MNIPTDVVDAWARAEGLTLHAGCWVAGGALVRALSGEDPADLDVWCATFDDHDRAYQELSATHTGKAGAFATTFGHVQLVSKLYKSGPPACIGDFDLSVCQLAWDGSRLYYGEHTLGDLEAGRLLRVLHKSTRTPKRLTSYAARGFRIGLETAISCLEAPAGGFEFAGYYE